MIIKMKADFGSEEARNSELTVDQMNSVVMVMSWLAFIVYSVALITVFLKTKKYMLVIFVTTISVYCIQFLLLAVLDTLYVSINQGEGGQQHKTSNWVIKGIKIAVSMLIRIKWLVLYYFVITIKSSVLML